jgi:hypothetical protein
MAGTKKYTTEMLKGIIDRFFAENKVFGQVTPSDIAKFARESLGYTKIIYQHFTRDKDSMEYINEINNAHSIGVWGDNQTIVEFNPDKFMETYGNDKKIQKIVLRQFADRHNALNQIVVDLRYTEVEYKKQIEELSGEIRKLKDTNRKLRNDNEKKSLAIKRLKRFKELEDQTKMREFLASKSLFNKMDSENLDMLLTKCGFIGEGYSDFDSEDAENLQSIDNDDICMEDDDLDVSDDAVDDAESDRIISFGDKKKDKVNKKEVDAFLKDFNDLV